MTVDKNTEYSDSEEPKNKKPRKPRKPSEGPLRDKARTMARMVASVGKVIQKKGYHGLTAPNIALAAGVNKQLVWTYFGGIDNLVEEYISQRDFWKSGAKSLIQEIFSNAENAGVKETNNILQAHLEIIMKDKIWQKIIHWELGENKKMLKDLAEKREETGEMLLNLIDPYFENTDVNIRARLALLIGGIYYLSLHAKSNGSTVCGIDVNEKEGRLAIEKGIKDIVFESFEKAELQKKNMR